MSMELDYSESEFQLTSFALQLMAAAQNCLSQCFSGCRTRGECVQLTCSRRRRRWESLGHTCATAEWSGAEPNSARAGSRRRLGHADRIPRARPRAQKASASVSCVRARWKKHRSAVGARPPSAADAGCVSHENRALRRAHRFDALPRHQRIAQWRRTSGAVWLAQPLSLQWSCTPSTREVMRVKKISNRATCDSRSGWW